MTMYNQALQCEKNGNFELAAVGFRAALEILVKDYAIKELKIDSETVSGKTLFNAIGEYLDEKPLVTSADVIRILGNDYAHYERKYPEHDFEILKEYMERINLSQKFPRRFPVLSNFSLNVIRRPASSSNELDFNNGYVFYG